MKSFAQVINSFNLGNATTQLEMSYVAMLLGVLGANQSSIEAIKASVDTLVTDLAAVPQASDEHTAAVAIQTTLSGLVTAGTTNPFQQVLASLSAYEGSPAYNHLKALLNDRAQKFNG